MTKMLVAAALAAFSVTAAGACEAHNTTAQTDTTMSVASVAAKLSTPASSQAEAEEAAAEAIRPSDEEAAD